MIKKIALASTLLFCIHNAFTTNYFYDKDLPISKKSRVKITKYENIAGGIFKGYVIGFDGEGPFYTKAEYLAKSVQALSFKKIHRKPKNIVGKTFVLNSKLETVVPPPDEKIKKK